MKMAILFRPTPATTRSSLINRQISASSTDEETPRKIYVDGVGATIVAERVEYLDENGRLVTETPAGFHEKGAEEAFCEPR